MIRSRGHAASAVLLCAVGITVVPASGQTIVGIGLPPQGTSSSARGVSADGVVVVGVSGAGSQGSSALRWTEADGALNLGRLPGGFTATANAANADGSVIVGISHAPGIEGHAFRWTAAGGMQDLGSVPVSPGYSIAHSVSADGNTVVGRCVGYGIRWTPAGMVALPRIGTTEASASSVSADGVVAVGYAGSRAVRWLNSGTPEMLPLLPGSTSASALAVSGNGLVVAGIGSDGVGFRWTAGGGIVPLPPTIEGRALQVRQINADGSVMVGNAGSDTPAIWAPALGTMELRTALPMLGVDLAGWELQIAYGLSADGRTIVGHGSHNGVAEGWVVRLPSSAFACYANCDASMTPPVLNVLDFACFVNRYAAGEAYANCDGSTTPPVLNILDFNCFVTRFGAGCGG